MIQWIFQDCRKKLNWPEAKEFSVARPASRLRCAYAALTLQWQAHQAQQCPTFLNDAKWIRDDIGRNTDFSEKFPFSRKNSDTTLTLL
jgi:hypothetical protein